MRLLHARSLKFQDFNESSLPPYAILSHTWDAPEEVTLQDMSAPYLPSKKGYAKITETCRLALSHGLEYAWIDTCCIDKTSSAELTESINSMFRWYQKARVCYVFLSDLHTTSAGPELARCAWLTRGWTLQELLAPRFIEFYNSKWALIGTKRQFEADLSTITRIPIHAINGMLPLRSFSVAQRMSWASRRVTTRVEDVAYCLMGLFDVQMPLIYGEGRKSFHRLQEEIVKRTMDMTLFAWVPSSATSSGYCSLLASSPFEFEQCGSIKSLPYDFEYSITNRGVKFTAFLLLQPTSTVAVGDWSGYKHVLPVGYVDDANKAEVGICIKKYGPGLFIREATPATFETPSLYHESGTQYASATHTFHVLVTVDPGNVTHRYYHPDLVPKGIYIPNHGHIKMSGEYSPTSWDDRTGVYYWPRSENDVTAFSFVAAMEGHTLPFGVIFDFRVQSESPNCLLIDKRTFASRLFFLFLLGNRSDPMKWKLIEQEMPDIMELTDRLKMVAGDKTFEITAGVERRYVEIDSWAVRHHTLDIRIARLDARTSMVVDVAKEEMRLSDRPASAKLQGSIED